MSAALCSASCRCLAGATKGFNNFHGEFRLAAREGERFVILLQSLFVARVMKIHLAQLVVLNAEFFVNIRVFVDRLLVQQVARLFKDFAALFVFANVI